MKSAIAIAADWPGDQVLLVMEPNGYQRIRQQLEGVDIARVGAHVVALVGRVEFATLHRHVAACLDRAKADGAAWTELRILSSRLDRIARELRLLREGDPSGDPPAGSPLARALEAAGADR